MGTYILIVLLFSVVVALILNLRNFYKTIDSAMSTLNKKVGNLEKKLESEKMVELMNLQNDIQRVEDIKKQNSCTLDFIKKEIENLKNIDIETLDKLMITNISVNNLSKRFEKFLIGITNLKEKLKNQGGK